MGEEPDAASSTAEAAMLESRRRNSRTGSQRVASSFARWRATIARLICHDTTTAVGLNHGAKS
jgi:hypothetical protein